MPNPEPIQKTETKSVKHVFTNDERNDLGSSLARSIAGLRGIETENDQVKAAYKARITEAEARIDNLSTSLMNGFEMRNKKCVVIYLPEVRKKHYVTEADFAATGAEAVPVLIEDMTADDFQAELIQAEAKFAMQDRIELFQPTEKDSGLLVVGQFAGKWFTALRIAVGKVSLEERLDSEQRSFKKRPDAVKHAAGRAAEWLKENFKDHAKGFLDSLQSAVEAHKERVE